MSRPPGRTLRVGNETRSIRLYLGKRLLALLREPDRLQVVPLDGAVALVPTTERTPGSGRVVRPGAQMAYITVGRALVARSLLRSGATYQAAVTGWGAGLCVAITPALQHTVLD